MREIKFRAWRKSGGRMNSWASLMAYFTEYPVMIAEAFEGEYDGDLVLMQYTGFKDRHGKEIYEGDVCGYTEDPSRFVVVFDDGSYRKKYVDWEGDDRTYLSLGQWDIDNLEVEILGNIYENPELTQ